MERVEIIGKLNEIFEDIIDEGPVSLSDTTTANDVRGWDSLANIQLIVAIEKSMNIKFTSEEILSWKNVGEVVDCILTK
jgi:acyl carrier protein